jgi:Tfp pilus assembly protein FimT
MLVRYGDGGFTLVELVGVMVLLALLGLAAVNIGYQTTANLDAQANKLRSNIQLAQEYAMTHGSAYGFNATGASAYEIYSGVPGTPAVDPLTRGNLTVSISPAQFSGSPPQISFNSSGVPSNGSDVTITMTEGSNSRTLTIATATGVVTLSNP